MGEKKGPRKEYRLPDGTHTTDVGELARVWEQFGKPFEELTGMVAFGYDPGITFSDPEGNEESIQIPSYILKRFNFNLYILKMEYEERIDELLTNSGD